MPASFSLTRRLVVGLALSWALPAYLSAAPAPPVKPDQEASPTAKVRKALDQPLHIKIQRPSLEMALATLGDAIGVRILLDGSAIASPSLQGRYRPSGIDLDLQGSTGRSALKTILAPYDLTYAIVGDTIEVVSQEAATARLMSQHISIDFDDIDLASALRGIARDTGVNVFLDPRAEKQARKKVTAQLEDVRLQSVVNLLSRSAGLKTVRVGTVLFVTTEAIADEMRRDPPLVPESDPRPIVSFDW